MIIADISNRSYNAIVQLCSGIHGNNCALPMAMGLNPDSVHLCMDEHNPPIDFVVCT